jgi:hypothetical protein
MLNQDIKEEVIKITQPLSLEDVNDIFYKIILQTKLERAEDDIKERRLFSTEQLTEKLKKWLK